MAACNVRAIEPADGAWVRDLLVECWSGVEFVSRGRLIAADVLPGFIAEEGGERVGLLTYLVEEGQWEVVTLNSLVEGRGVGTALLEVVIAAARAAGFRRLWLITTNDNIEAFRFYQRRGWQLAAVYPKALDVARRLKITLPIIGLHDIPLRDEIEFEYLV